MKGVELIATLIAFLFMVGISIFLSGIIITALNFARTSQNYCALLGVNCKVSNTMYLYSAYPPLKYETMLLSYLEVTVENIQIKKLLAYAAYQKNVTNIFVDDKEIKSLRSKSSAMMWQWLGKNGYLLALSIDGKPYVLADNKRAFPIASDDIVRLKRISIPVYLDVESTRGQQPLSVTLDLYVQ